MLRRLLRIGLVSILIVAAAPLTASARGFSLRS